MKYLTKSKFKTALECPTKLFYGEHEELYANAKLDDPFLNALAKGGFQVGELAKYYYSGGHQITDNDYDISCKKTIDLLKQTNVTIFEAAIRYKNLFIRIDILNKVGNTLNLIEVKSKSTCPDEFEKELWDSRKLKKNVHSLKDHWRSYLYDIAFQSFVLKKAFPNLVINNFLMCMDKSKVCTVDGLNQKFILKNDGDKTHVEVKKGTSSENICHDILRETSVDNIIEVILNNKEKSVDFEGKTFEDAIFYFAESLQSNTKITTPIGKRCKKCEFRRMEEGKKCGFNECWTNHGLLSEELKQPLIFDVWNFKNAKKAIEKGKYLMKDLDATDFSSPSKKGGVGLLSVERQLLQVEKVKDNDESSYFDSSGMKEEMSLWKYPLHMIDFETCMVAIPFNKGQRPYEQIAFQFSHHMIYEDGSIHHANEYINTTPGLFPNFEFVCELKKSLGDSGTIFRYAPHENTVLCHIREQLLNSNRDDKDELISFIEDITYKKEKGTNHILWKGRRNMVDLCEMVKRYYYSPITKGSNSIKYVLPAILNESKYIQNKYCKPIYGKNAQIKSKNFESHTWISWDKKGNVISPYNTLPPIFDKWDYEQLELVMSDDDADISNGGAALTAYAMMQFTHMSDLERDKIRAALLRYCELDTLAMVMIWEHWHDLVQG